MSCLATSQLTHSLSLYSFSAHVPVPLWREVQGSTEGFLVHPSLDNATKGAVNSSWGGDHIEPRVLALDLACHLNWFPEERKHWSLSMVLGKSSSKSLPTDRMGLDSPENRLLSRDET